MKSRILLGFLLLAACANPSAWEDECRSKYTNEIAIEMCVSNARADYRQSMDNLSQSLSGMTLQGQQQGGYAAPQSRGLIRTLRRQWVQNGNRMCQYSDGTVMNIGVGVCRPSI
jgi:hypothetical protein